MTPRQHLLLALRDAHTRAEAVFAEESSAGARLSPRAATARERAAQLRRLVVQVEGEVELERVREVGT